MPALILAAAVQAGATPAQDAEGLVRRVPSAESFARHLRYLTEAPHQTGTPRNMELESRLGP